MYNTVLLYESINQRCKHHTTNIHSLHIHIFTYQAVPAFGTRVTALAKRAQTGALNPRERGLREAKEREGRDKATGGDAESGEGNSDLKLQFQELTGEMATKGVQVSIIWIFKKLFSRWLESGSFLRPDLALPFSPSSVP